MEERYRASHWVSSIFRRKMKNLVKSYIYNQDAKEEIVTVILMVLGLAVALGAGWWIWGLIQDWTAKGTTQSNNQNKVDLNNGWL